ncbi:putative histone acetyltransferase chromatin regulator PHD family [Dioscorea sansibarensis]
MERENLVVESGSKMEEDNLNVEPASKIEERSLMSEPGSEAAGKNLMMEPSKIEVKNFVEPGSKAEEIMKMLFGEEISELTGENSDSGLKEHEIFMEVFYGNSAIDVSKGNARVTDIQPEENIHVQRQFRGNCHGLTMASPSSRKRSPVDAELCGSSSSQAYANADSASSKRLKISPGELLDKDFCNAHADRGKCRIGLEQLGTVSVVLLPESDHSPQASSCLIVESSSDGILSSNYIFVPKGEKDCTYDDDCSLSVQHNAMSQHGDRGKEVLEAISVASPVSQESFASALVKTGLPPAVDVTARALSCVNPGARECGVLEWNAFSPKEKKSFIKGLPNRLSSHAHNLLMDAHWKIDSRKRCDRDRPAYCFTSPDDGRSYKALTQAWKAFGQKFLADAQDPEQHQIGREWSDIERFWADLADTLAYIEKEIQQSESFLSLSDRWLLLDPFMAVCWIDKRISALREGMTMKAVNSTTYLMKGDGSTTSKEKNVNRVKGHLPEQNSCSLVPLNNNILPELISDGKLDADKGPIDDQVFALQCFDALPHNCLSEQVEQKLSCHGTPPGKGVKRLAKGPGKGFDIGSSHDMNCKSLTSQCKESDSTSCECRSIQNVSSLSHPEGYLDHDLSAPDTAAPDLEALAPYNPESGEIALPMKIFECAIQNMEIPCDSDSKSLMVRMVHEDTSQQMPDTNSEDGTLHFKSNDGCAQDPFICEKTSVEKALNTSVKKARKKSKKISEIGSTKVRGKSMEAKHTNQSCEEAFCLTADCTINDQSCSPTERDGSSSIDQELTSKGMEQNEFLGELCVFNALATDTSHLSALPEVNSTTEVQKFQKSESRSAKKLVKCKDDDLPSTQDDESGITLLNIERDQDDSMQVKSTKSKGYAKSSNLKKSMSMSLSKQKSQPKSNKAKLQSLISEQSLALKDNCVFPEEPHCIEKSNELLDSANGVSQDSRNNEVVISVEKSEVHKQIGRKRWRGCSINDDDLLISAIMKSKDVSSVVKHSSPKLGASQSKALRKLKGKKSGCKLLLRTPGKGSKHSTDGRRFLLGSRTVLCWLLEMAIISQKDILQCRDPKTKAVIKDGWVTVDGILCNCCTKIFSVTEFKAHAGLNLQKPSSILFLQSGKAYTVCQLEAWSAEYKARKGCVRVVEVEEVDQNDDTCGLCGDGGELICCDNCPSTYHRTCLPEQELPEGSWFCSGCICSICGEVAKVNEGSSSLNALQCSQCERRYHDSCLEDNVTRNTEAASQVWFCGGNCQEVYLGLRSRIGVVNNINDGFSWSILRCCDSDQKVYSKQKIALVAECHSKLAIALTLMEECFLPMVDPRTGIDMIPQVLYNWGSNFARLNFRGFYTVILENDDHLVSVASIRVHGVRVAEMPLIATCSGRRRQGMCRKLLNAVEEMLKSLNVEMLVLSAIPSLVETWTSGFGFAPIGEEERKQLRDINFMLFPGTEMLKKNLCAPPATDSGGNSEFFAGEDQAQKLGLPDESTEIGATLHASGNAKFGLEEESLLNSGLKLPVEQADDQQRNQLALSCKNHALTVNDREHVEVDMTGSYNLNTETMDGYKMDQFASADNPIAFEVSVTNDSSLGPPYSGLLSTSAAASEQPNDFSTNRTGLIIQDTAFNMLHNINVLPKGDAEVFMNTGADMDYPEDDKIKPEVFSETSGGTCGSGLSQELDQKDLVLATSNELKLVKSDKVSDNATDIINKEWSMDQSAKISNESSGWSRELQKDPCLVALSELKIDQFASNNVLGNATNITYKVGAMNHHEDVEVKEMESTEISKENNDICLSQRATENSPCPVVPNLSKMKLEELVAMQITINDSHKNETRDLTVNHLEPAKTDLNQVGIPMVAGCSSRCQGMLLSSGEDLGEDKELSAV